LDFAKKLASDYEVIKLLKLTSQHGVSTVLPAVQKALDCGSYSCEGVLRHLEEREQPEPAEPPVNLVQVNQVDLGIYDTMVWGGESA